MTVVNLSNKGLKEWPSMPVDVSEVIITDNQLVEVPDSIGTYPLLVRIIATSNNISRISENLTKLNRLIDLRLDSNGLEQIPKTIYKLTNLQTLVLDKNNIISISPNINNLRNLHALHLGSNSIKSLPASIGNLKKITILQLQINQLKELPKEIGELRNLSLLNLVDNPIEYLPPEIANCTQLKILDLRGTKLPLPSPYNISDPQATIQYVLKHQKEPAPELSIKKAFVFNNLSKPSLIVKYDDILKTYFEEIKVEFEYIETPEEINKLTTVVLIVIAFDVHENPALVFEIIKACKVQKVKYKILFQQDFDSSDEVHLEKGAEIQKTRGFFEKKYKFEINSFNAIDELKGLILSALHQHSPEVVLKSLWLNNIGHFVDTHINFEKNLTCLIGENGQGKSSILRALSLVITGVDNTKIREDPSLQNLLRIEKITDDGKIIYPENPGIIQLDYTVDSVEYFNEVMFISKDEGRVIDISGNSDFEINSGDFNLKSLIVGFPQLRGRSNEVPKINRYSQPHIDDLIPLITNRVDFRLDSFIQWVANLYGEAIKQENREDTREFAIICYVFELISELTKKDIAFQTVQQFSPPIVIIKTEDSPGGVPLNLISQGFKTVIGWIGYFIQRMMEANPLSNPENVAEEHSILIIDEIDSSIHPTWQTNLLPVLRKKFPNTQIICSTHSPLMVAGLNREQIVQIKSVDNKIVAEQNSFDTWVTTYQEIFEAVFDTHEFVPKVTIEELERQLEQEDDEIEQQKISDQIERLKENARLTDDLERRAQLLDEKEKELDELIDEYTKKIGE